jgi:hypothetical protein
MPAQRSNRKLLTLAGIIAVAVGASAYWALAPAGGDDDRGGARATGAGESPGEPGARASSAAEWAALQRTIEDLAKSNAMPAARKQALDALPAAADPSTKISVLLSAIEADQAEPEQDPMWADLVQAVAALWGNETLGWGLSLMHSEARPKARRAVISSLARLAASERGSRMGMAPEHRELLQNNLIDLYQGLAPEEKPQVLAGLEKIASRDVVAVLQGRGLYDESLDSHKPYVQAREESRAGAAAHAQAEAEAEAKMLAEARAQAEAARAASAPPGAPGPTDVPPSPGATGEAQPHTAPGGP